MSPGRCFVHRFVREMSVRAVLAWMATGLLASLALPLDLQGQVETRRQALSVSTSGIWSTTKIPVCYLNPSDGNSWTTLPLAIDTMEMRWVREAVEETWEAVSAVDFEFGGACKRGATGIKILILDDKDVGPRVRGGLGQQMDDMVLNFTFDDWDTTTTCASPESRR